MQLGISLAKRSISSPPASPMIPISNAIGAGETVVYQGLSIDEVTTLVIKLKKQDQPIVWNGHQ